jgi:D-glutamate cyclase
MSAFLESLASVMQEDVNRRGLCTDPASNLITATAGDFAAACRNLAETPQPAVAIVTGFIIAHAQPPAGETDGPLGALFLARALVPLGFKVVLATDPFCARALEIGLAVAGLRKSVSVVSLPTAEQAGGMSIHDYWQWFTDRAGALTHLIALERAGPSHTPESVRAQSGEEQPCLDFLNEVSDEHHDRCHSMRGLDITTMMSPAHRLFEVARQEKMTTISIGDGGNEIGMGKIPWDVIRRNVPRGGMVACRVPTDYLIVCGISNWGAYALAAGVAHLRGQPLPAEMFDPEREWELLQVLVERGGLVDGVTGAPEATVDALSFAQYGEALRRLGEVK